MQLTQANGLLPCTQIHNARHAKLKATNQTWPFSFSSPMSFSRLRWSLAKPAARTKSYTCCLPCQRLQVCAASRLAKPGVQLTEAGTLLPTKKQLTARPDTSAQMHSTATLSRTAARLQEGHLGSAQQSNPQAA